MIEVRRGTAACLTHGLLLPASPSQLPSTFSRATVVPEVADAAASIHEVQVALEPTMGPARYVVVSRPYDAKVRQAVERALARDAPGASPIFIVASREGSAEVSASEAADPDAVAVAVAEVQRAAAWDDSPHIIVTVNGDARQVTLTWAKTAAAAVVEPSAG